MDKKMTPDDMKALVRKCMTGFSTNDLSALDGCFHDNYKRNVTPGIKDVSSYAEHVEDLRHRHKAMADAHFEIDEMIAEGNLVAARFTMVGVHVGEFHGVPATGKTIRRQQISFFRIEDGKIAESWNVQDVWGMMNELQKKD